MGKQTVTLIFTETRGGMDASKASEEAHRAAAQRMTDAADHYSVTAYTAQTAVALAVAAPYFCVTVTITATITAVDSDITSLDDLDTMLRELDGSIVNPRLF